MGEQAAVFDDGWIAIARLRPYRVDWIDPAGRMRFGKPLPHPADDSTPPFTSLFETLNDLTPALKHGPAGELVIRRYPSPSEPVQRYDVVDRTGELVAQIILPPRETLLGVGKAHLYTAKTGDDGKQRLRRYAWPLK
jgi:hypothetical protein